MFGKPISRQLADCVLHNRASSQRRRQNVVIAVDSGASAYGVLLKDLRVCLWALASMSNYNQKRQSTTTRGKLQVAAVEARQGRSNCNRLS